MLHVSYTFTKGDDKLVFASVVLEHCNSPKSKEHYDHILHLLKKIEGVKELLTIIAWNDMGDDDG